MMHRLISDNLEAIQKLCRTYCVRRMDVFGSVTTDHFDPERSDIDLLVEFDDQMQIRRFKAYFALKQDLEKLFGRKVDLIEPGGVRNEYYRRGIEATREPLYAA